MQNNSRKRSYSDVMSGDYSLKYNEIILQNNPQNIPPYQQIHQLNREILFNRVLGLVKGLQVLAKNQVEIERQKELLLLDQQMPESSVFQFQVNKLNSTFKDRE